MDPWPQKLVLVLLAEKKLLVGVLHNCPPVSDISLLKFLTSLPCKFLQLQDV